jgi:hypothetical protein
MKHKQGGCYCSMIDSKSGRKQEKRELVLRNSLLYIKGCASGFKKEKIKNEIKSDHKNGEIYRFVV